MAVTKLKEVKVKDPYRKKANESDADRAVRVHAESRLKSEHARLVREAGKADLLEVKALQDEIAGVSTRKHSGVQELKLLAGRLSRECDRIIARDKANEIADEMIRIKLAAEVK